MRHHSPRPPDPGYPAPHSPYSHAVVANGFVFVSGQIPVRPAAGRPRSSVRRCRSDAHVLRNVQAILRRPAARSIRVVKVTVLLARPLYREMKEAYAEFFPARNRPRDGAVRADIPGVQVAIERSRWAG